MIAVCDHEKIHKVTSFHSLPYLIYTQYVAFNKKHDYHLKINLYSYIKWRPILNKLN